jgi:hypothetical protein
LVGWRGRIATAGAGIITSVPQFGHFPFLPAAESGVRTCWRQVGQGNSIGINDGRKVACYGIRRQRSVFARQGHILIRLRNECSATGAIGEYEVD